MGTNFYWTRVVKFRKDDDPKVHIGKRSAAGAYCWDCGLTIIRDWREGCPKCGQKPVKEGLSAGPAAVELGFAEPRQKRPTGVRGCSSFTWSQEPSGVMAKCLKFPNRFLKVVVDEYGRKMTGRKFVRMLDANCPVQFIDSIGQWFS